MANEGILAQLEKMLATDRLVHSFLFFGGSSDDRASLAFSFRDMIIAGHPEDHIPVTRQQGKAGIGTEDIESLQEKLKYKPYGSRYAVIIEDAQLMNAAAQNKLLKTLEEPVSPAVIMLLSEQKEALLPTVLSRCSCYQLAETAVPEDARTADAAEAMLDAVKKRAPFYRKKALLEYVLNDKEGQREKALSFLDAFERRLLEASKNAGDPAVTAAADEVRNARRCIRQLHNTGYTLKQLCLRI